MPDSYTNVGPGAPTVQTNRPARFTTTDEPALAAMRPMEMSAPIASMAPVSVPGEVPHEASRVVVPAAPTVAAVPLLADVAPFKQVEPRVPATEYVMIPTTRPQNAPKSRSAAATPLPPSTSVDPVVKNSQSPPPAAIPVPPVKAAAVAPLPQPKPLIPLVPTSPSRAAAAPSPAKQLSVSAVQPSRQLAPPAPVAADIVETPSQSAAPDPLENLPPTPLEAAAPADAQVQQSVAMEPLMIYSNNTRAVWQARRAGKRLNMVIGGCALLLVGAILAYWLSIGSPTRLQDVPIMSANPTSP